MRAITRILTALAFSLPLYALALPATAVPAGPAAKRSDMLAMGVDMMPVGTARQVDRMRRMRRQMP